MNDREGLGGGRPGEPQPPLVGDPRGDAHAARGAPFPKTAVAIAVGGALVVVGYVIISAQDPNRRKEATAVIAEAPSAAVPSAPRRGAIARSASKKKVVIVNDFATDAAAEAAARETCGASDCVLIETFVASCVARAVGKDDRQEIVYGHVSREAAEQAALKKCGKACSIQTSSCPEAR